MIEVLKKYEGIAGARARGNGATSPARLGENAMSLASDYIPGSTFWAHIWWMCGETQKLVEEGRMDKANRWLGFIQAVLWSEGSISINDLKADNMPTGSTFDPVRV